MTLQDLALVCSNDDTLRNHGTSYTGVCVACSSGPDSVALLYFLYELNKKHDLFKELSVVHMNYGLRGQESDKDQTFVEELCKKLGISCFVYRPSQEQKKLYDTMNTQKWARELRYSRFRFLADKGWHVAIAHTRDDLVENILFRMSRGSGPKELIGMSEYQGPYWRPFLRISKSHILLWLAQKQKKYRIDSSNLKLLYSRNVIRHKVIPTLNSICPSAGDHILRTCEQNLDLFRYLLRTFDLDKKVIKEANQWKLAVDSLVGLEKGAALCVLAEFVQNFSEGQVPLYYDKLSLMFEGVVCRPKSKQFQLADNIFWKYSGSFLVLFRKQGNYSKEVRFKQHEAGLLNKKYFFALSEGEEVEIFPHQKKNTNENKKLKPVFRFKNTKEQSFYGFRFAVCQQNLSLASGHKKISFRDFCKLNNLDLNSINDLMIVENNLLKNENKSILYSKNRLFEIDEKGKLRII